MEPQDIVLDYDYDYDYDYDGWWPMPSEEELFRRRKILDAARQGHFYARWVLRKEYRLRIMTYAAVARVNRKIKGGGNGYKKPN